MSYYRQRMAEIKAEKEREFDRVEKRVKTKPLMIEIEEKEPVHKLRALPPAPDIAEESCAVCFDTAKQVINGFNVCKSERCKYIAWSF